jgi:hypothetical protein
MSDDRFPYLKNFLKPTRGGSAISDKTPSEEFSALLAPDGLVRPGKKFSSGAGDLHSISLDGVPRHSSRHPHPCRNHTPTPEAPQASAPERILSCSECPCYAENPWTHYPELPAWCNWHFDHLAANNPGCIGYRQGDVPQRPDRPQERR